MNCAVLGKICAVTDSDVGSRANSPTQIPVRGWRQVLGRAWHSSQEDNVSMLAAGVAFFGFLALFPALIALVTLVGVIADPTQITQQVESFTAGLPPTSRQLISDQLNAITEQRWRADHRAAGLAASGTVECIEWDIEPHGGGEHRLRGEGDA